MAIETAAETVKPTPPRCRVAHAWLTAEIYALLEEQAKRRGTSADALAADLVTQMALRMAKAR